MTAWARLVTDCRRTGADRTVRLTDALIAAAAIVHGLPVVTQDEDFDQIAAAPSAAAGHQGLTAADLSQGRGHL